MCRQTIVHAVDDVLSDALLHGRVGAGDQVVMDLDEGNEVGGGPDLGCACCCWWWSTRE